jgi:UDP-GlcNAc:undecaprenyl-phosphate GlcNAc-1-phosphate transferase
MASNTLTLLFLGLSACVLTLSATPLVRYWAVRFRLVDNPDGQRKVHEVPIPRLGGLAIAMALVLSFALTRVVAPQLAPAFESLWPLVPGACLIFAIGLYDDIYGLKARHKLAAQFVAAVIAVMFGVCITDNPGHIGSAWWAYPLTVLWLVICTNSINLIDGLDGLAAGISIFATAAIVVASAIQGDFLFAAIGVPLLGSLIGFLRSNSHPATIFLGDCGSLLVGFFLGCYSAMWGQHAPTAASETMPLVALAIPLTDVGLTITRRVLRAHPIFCPDRGHIHHRLLARGHSAQTAVFLLYVAAAFFFVVALCIHASNRPLLCLTITCVFAYYMVRYLKYAEFSIAGHALTLTALQELIASRLRLHTFKEQILLAETPEDCWDILKTTYRDFGFHEISLQFDGDFRIDRCEAKQSLWRVEIPISSGLVVSLRYTSSLQLHDELVGGFVLVVRDALSRAIWAASHSTALQPVVVPVVSATITPGV